MPGHKRKRPKNKRAGCLHCKPHKMNGMGRESKTVQERRQPSLEEAVADYYEETGDIPGLRIWNTEVDWGWDVWGEWDDELSTHEVAPGRFSFGGIHGHGKL